LQDELDSKDKMLSMLTDGLKEVEVSQNQWLHRNHELSIQLDATTRKQNDMAAEIKRLKASNAQLTHNSSHLKGN
jgi:hypothetical protein